MKNRNEMNGNERIAYRNIKGIFEWEVGGWYNCIQDHCTEYIPDTMEDAKAIIYDECLVDSAGEGWYQTRRAPKEMRFAGSDFIHGVIDHLFETDADIAEIKEVKSW